MTTCLEMSCSFGLPCVPFVNCCQFIYLVISLLVLGAGYEIMSVPDHCLPFSFTMLHAKFVFLRFHTGRGSSIGSEFAWHASGPEFDPHVRHTLSWRLGHENISTAILPLPLIQEEQLSVTGERMCTKYW